MKRTIRFAVAKYVPDLHRHEPRNIGVVLWANDGSTTAKFLGEREGKVYVPGMVDSNARHAYRQWIVYWRHQLSADRITNRDGEFVLRDSPSYFDTLLAKSKDQFFLSDVGFFPSKLASLGELQQELYERLVDRPPQHKSKAELAELTLSTRKLIDSVTVQVPVQHNLPLPVNVFGAHRTFTVDVAWGQVGKPRAVLQKVLLTRNQNVNSNALMLQSLTGNGYAIPKENCAAFVNTAQELGEEEQAGLDMLAHVATIIDVSQPTALKQIEEIANRVSAYAAENGDVDSES